MNSRIGSLDCPLSASNWAVTRSATGELISPMIRMVRDSYSCFAPNGCAIAVSVSIGSSSFIRTLTRVPPDGISSQFLPLGVRDLPCTTPLRRLLEQFVTYRRFCGAAPPREDGRRLHPRRAVY